jgi:predicted pyridoxine 5'-phosphate oxidase superfamily flavin-nucleotide-binding protein
VPDSDLDDPAVREFLTRSRFLTVTSTDADGGTDVSPKGDEAGFAVPLGPRVLAFPDRPGNRRTDTLRNLLQHPEVSLLALVAGDDRVLHVRGRASITDDPDLRARLAAGLAQPELAVVVEVDHVDLTPNRGLAAARLWNPEVRGGHAELPRAGQIWTDHLALDNVG